MKKKAAAAKDVEFIGGEEKAFIDGFLERGYAIIPLAQRERLDALRGRLYEEAMRLLGLSGARRPSQDQFFDDTQKYVSVDKLNAFRLGLIEFLNRDERLRPDLFHMARRPIEWAIGNEIAMQRTINLSIQLPKDDSSLLPLHSDVWSGNSPYEIVLWLPLVDCYRTKSMYLLPRRGSEKVLRRFKDFSALNSEQLFKKIRPDLVWLDVPRGSAVLFTHSLLHGNRVNLEKTTRWGFNVRIKGLLTPYGIKELGESFMPVIVRPATRIGFEHVEAER
jgi:sporadic carbohydrate cluster 2OG-Fe(II) oxygenase